MPRGGQRSADRKLEAVGKDPAPRGSRLTWDPWSLPCDMHSHRPGLRRFYSFAAAAPGS